MLTYEQMAARYGPRVYEQVIEKAPAEVQLETARTGNSAGDGGGEASQAIPVDAPEWVFVDPHGGERSSFGEYVAFDGFWSYTSKGGERQANFAGFELNRWTSRSDESGEPAHKLVCALVPSNDGKFFGVVPLMLRVTSSRASVFTGEEINVHVWGRVDGTWVDFGLSQTQALGTFELHVTGYDLGQKDIFYFTPKRIAGWVAPVPVSQGHEFSRSSRKIGAFALSVKVVEEDVNSGRVFARFTSEQPLRF